MNTTTLSPIETPAFDRKRYLWILSAVVPTLPLAGYALFNLTGWHIFWWFAIIFIYALLPALDYILGGDRNNPPESAVPELENDRYYRVLTYLFLPIQYGVFFWGIWAFATIELPWYSQLGLAISIGGIGGLGINTAHELGHKKPELERWLAKIALAQTFYGHFFTEHTRGHHKNVATPEDPASSRFGESFYQFWPRTVIGSVKSAWKIEKDRLARKGKSVWSIENHNLQAWAMSLVLWVPLLAIIGVALVPFMIIQAIYGFSLLEVVNYLEHYGLVRQKDANGRYERCQPEHSWNSNHLVTNLFLYHLQRHSDHHANPTRRYQALRHFKDVPQLPSGYAGMVVLAYIPPLWRKVMDKRVIAHYEGDLRKANLQPGKEAQILAKYPPPATA